MERRAWCVVVALALGLAACGDDAGRDSETSPPTTQPPPTDPSSTGTSEVTTDGTATDGTAGTATEASASSTGTTAGSSSGTSAGTTDPGTSSSSSGQSESESSSTGFEPEPIPVHEIPGLLSITFYERTGGDAPTEYTFTVLGPELTTQLADPLHDGNFDIDGASTEFYDVHYSDVDGNFDVDGSYLTIAGTFGQTLPNGGGLNLAEISLNYEDDSVEFGSFLASFVALGDNAFPETAENAIDGDLQTHTTMGNNALQPDMRLRVTLGFMSSLVPE